MTATGGSACCTQNDRRIRRSLGIQDTYCTQRRHDQSSRPMNWRVLTIVSGSASFGDGCRKEAPADDRHTQHAGRGTERGSITCQSLTLLVDTLDLKCRQRSRIIVKGFLNPDTCVSIRKNRNTRMSVTFGSEHPVRAVACLHNH